MCSSIIFIFNSFSASIFKMKTLIVFLTLSVCFRVRINGQSMSRKSSSLESPVKNEMINNERDSLMASDILYDPQVLGFNSTNITSGPIVLVNQKTLFIPNIWYNSLANTLYFWAGTGSPYNEVNLVAEEINIRNYSNVCVTFSNNITLGSVDFFGVSFDQNFTLREYVIFGKINRNAIKEYEGQGCNMEGTKAVYRVPKCCPQNYYYNSLRQCTRITNEDVYFNVSIFESNATGLDPEVTLNLTQYEFRPYVKNLVCPEGWARYVADETDSQPIVGLIYNSSLIVQRDGIKSHGEFCLEVYIDENNISNTISLLCGEPQDTPKNLTPNLYLPVLIISTICLILSVVAYGLILKVKDIYKKCFLVFSSSMTATFLSLIILNVQSNKIACGIFGFVFLFSTVLSFIWLWILCSELLYLVRYPLERDRNDQRWIWFLVVSFAVSGFLLVISLFSGELWIPDVPHSFVKFYRKDECDFSTKPSRTAIVFVPMYSSVIFSIVCLILVKINLNKNEKTREIRNTHDWIENKNSYNFLFRTHLVVIGVIFFWLLNLVYIFDFDLGTTKIALDIIEAVLGVVILSCFVLNRYTWKEIRPILFQNSQKKKITEETLGLNGFPTPPTPGNELDDPFIIPPNNTSTNHSTTFNNR